MLEECPKVKVGDIVKCGLKINNYQDRLQGMIGKNAKGHYMKILKEGDPSMTLLDASFFRALTKWWRYITSSEGPVAQMARQSGDGRLSNLLTQQASTTGKRPLLCLKDFRESVNYFDFYCKVLIELESKHVNSRAFIITDYTENEVYDDYPFGFDGESLSPPLLPSYVAMLTLWDNHVEASHNSSIQTGSYLFIRNAKLKKDSSSRLEVCLHGDTVYPNKKNIFALGDDQPEIQDLISRERNLVKLHVPESQPISSSIVPPTPSFRNSSSFATSQSIQSPPIPPSIPLSATAPLSNTFAIASSSSTLSEVPATATESQKIIKLLQPLSGGTYPLPHSKIEVIQKEDFVPKKFLIHAKVVDYMPWNLCHFVRANCSNCNTSVFLDPSKPSNSVACPKCPSLQLKFQYEFAFLLTDGTGYLPVILSGPEALQFLNVASPTSLTSEELRERLKLCADVQDVKGGVGNRVGAGSRHYDWFVESYRVGELVRFKLFNTTLN